MKRHAFPFPLPLEALDEFRHPAEWHGLHKAMIHDGEVLAGNGFIAIRARRGHWLDTDFEPATAEFLSRFGKLPWGRFDAIGKKTCWRATDDQRGVIFKSGRLAFWKPDGGRWPSPVWYVNEQRVRLSLLQLAAMLPRCEIYCGPTDRTEPLFFRFSGGIGMIAHDRRLEIHSKTLFSPNRNTWSSARSDA